MERRAGYSQPSGQRTRQPEWVITSVAAHAAEIFRDYDIVREAGPDRHGITQGLYVSGQAATAATPADRGRLGTRARIVLGGKTIALHISWPGYLF